MIGHYLVTPCSWRAKSGETWEGDDNYANPQTIPTRWNPKQQSVTNEAGELLGSDTEVETTAPVKVGDLLTDETGREWPVIALAIYYHLGGAEMYRVAYL